MNFFIIRSYIYNFLIIVIYLNVSSAQLKQPNLKQPSKDANFGPCTMCKLLVESFNKGLEKTSNNKHEGGDAAWEEEKLGSYKTSEIRLVEIQESLCEDIKKGRDQCHNLAIDNDHLIEEWWFKHQSDHDLLSWLCIDKLAACCPADHFGAQCLKCADCNGNGKCKGNGTRKGNGQCKCDTGYTGEFCNECAVDFYESYRDDSKLLCSLCHTACGEGGCTTGGPKGCRKCKIGWSMDPEKGCFDINECVAKPNICHRQQFCVNNEGSYSCLDCDRSCDGCDGDGPDMCIKCSQNFELRDGKCTDLTNEKRDEWVVITRYLTYFGLVVATVAIFQSNTYAAAAVGTIVGVYITFSEYWLNSSPSSASPKFDTSQLEDLIKNSL